MDPTIADDLLTWQLLATEKCSSLYRGLTSVSSGGTVLLCQRPSRTAEELAGQWAQQPKSEPVPERIEDFIPATLFEEATMMLAFQAPQLEEVGVSLQLAGIGEFGSFLIEESKDALQEKDELVQLLKEYDRNVRTGVRRIGPSNDVVFMNVPKALHVHGMPSKQGTIVAAFARDLAMQKKAMYYEIYICHVEGHLDPTPLRMFAEKGLKRTEARLKVLDDVKFYGGV